jgi:hypothetical protein
MSPRRRTLTVGSVRWHLATSVICAGPSERLIVTRGLGESDEEALAAILSADVMEWRDHGGRRWSVERSPGGLRFVSHYLTLGPVPAPATRGLAQLGDAELETLLARAREGCRE